MTCHAAFHARFEVVSTAGAVAIPTGGERLAPDSAPDEVRQVGEALNGVLDRIDAGLGDMRTFTASLAHELRSPLQNLMGETEVALLDRRSAEEYEQLLGSHMTEFQRISDAIDNLAAWCRTASPSGPPSELETFDLRHEVRLRLARDERSARSAGVSLDITTSGDLSLMADREGCLRVMRNLVANAVSWSPVGGRVSVDLKADAEHVVLTVQDQGPGVPEDLGARIFEAFISGQPTEGRRSGYGLGLSICRQVLTDHGGTIRFENPAEGGARFEARFPRRRWAG